MTDKLPPNLLALFAPRPPLRWVPPSDHAPADRKTANISGVAAFLPQLEEYKKTDVYYPTESWLQRKDRIKLEKKERQLKLEKEGPTNCEPHSKFDCSASLSLLSFHSYILRYKANVINLDTPHEDPNIRGDAFKTLIVARLSYEANEKDLENEFGRFGPIERVSERARYAISGPITDSLNRSVSLLIPTKMT